MGFIEEVFVYFCKHVINDMSHERCNFNMNVRLSGQMNLGYLVIFYVGVCPRNNNIQSGRLLKISGFLLIIIDLKFTYWFLIAVFIWSRFRGFGSAFSSTSFVLSAFRTPRTIFRNQKRFKQSSNAGIISQNIIIVFGTLNNQFYSPIRRLRHQVVR